MYPLKSYLLIALQLIPHVPADCIDLICKLLAYNPDDRLSARQALRHGYFRYGIDCDSLTGLGSVTQWSMIFFCRDLREAEKRQKAMMMPDAVTGPPRHGVTVGRRETDGSEATMSKTGAGSHHRYSVGILNLLTAIFRAIVLIIVSFTFFVQSPNGSDADDGHHGQGAPSMRQSEASTINTGLPSISKQHMVCFEALCRISTHVCAL